MRPYVRSSHWALAALVLVVGLVVGSALAEAFGQFVPLLARSTQAGVDVSSLNLAGVLDLGFRLMLKVNLGTAIGVLVSAWVLRRLF